MKNIPVLEEMKRKLLGELAYKVNTEQMTQTAMARKIGVHQSAMAEIFSGKRRASLDWLINALTRLGHDVTIVIKEPKLHSIQLEQAAMNYFSLRYKILGGHVHCRLFSATNPNGTWAKNGDIVFTKGEEFKEFISRISFDVQAEDGMAHLAEAFKP